ncbi:ABC transporter substrate-binding protein [Neorhizobium alkalisoli]|uniref:Putative spermidine/putrescine transport system substrate-binding protein/mannopine transport system substrate-binding protein n=1 Tax=Neorhizobium alkalisoli TaxID=528178 RepID=A0A561PZ88_9HYPH|nr:ABC transporter substrate-binding protein [Neorhizobium alkalisoli]TWF43431.1 putative spermidine/putrescine transport system substrate-binding protein/mannopine transport system substrate-binding protein [Neorhizobium alkalisoli]
MNYGIRHAFLICTTMTTLLFSATAQAEDLVIAATGGAFYQALKRDFFDPFTAKTGINIKFVEATTLEMNGKMRAMLSAGNVEYDILTTTGDSSIGDADVYQAIDCTKIPNAGTFGVPGACSDKSLLRTIGANLIAYDAQAFPSGGPKSWVDFWDVKRFPGDRCLIGGTTDNHIPLLAALLADGVKPADLYPIDYDRAIRKLEELKPHVAAYWTSYSQSQQLLRDGECVMSIMSNGRAQALSAEGSPVKVVWNQALVSPVGWGLAKNAPHPQAAYTFLDFWMTRPDAHLDFYKAFFYGTANKDLITLLTPEDQQEYYASAQNLPGQITVDSAWVGANLKDIQLRYARFLTQ